MQRIKTSDTLFLFVCGDIELNPGPVNTSNMSVLTTRLARTQPDSQGLHLRYGEDPDTGWSRGT